MTFAMILHLAEMYCEQYEKRNLCLSPEQNEAFFRDFVNQYYSGADAKGTSGVQPEQSAAKRV